MLVLILLMGVGVTARKTGITGDISNQHLSKLLTYVLQTAMILSSVMNVESSISNLEVLGIIGFSAALYAILGVFAFIIPILLRAPKKDYGNFRFITMFGNVAYVGFPVIASIYGPEAVFYASLFNIPFHVLTYSLGVILLTGGESKKIELKKLINAPFAATVIAVIIFFFRIPVHATIAEACSLLGSATVPVGMIIIGTSLGGISPRKLFGDLRVYLFAPIKLIAAPAAVYFALRPFIASDIILGTAVLLAGMPVAAISTTLCIEYGRDESLASKAIFITTVLSAVSIPLVFYLFL